jgi:23S rRNA (guanine745-N1)-methyltransferase
MVTFVRLASWSPATLKASPIFACPVCGAQLPRVDRVYRCTNGHSFDVAREGYVNLLLAQQKRSRDPGYNKAMMRARQRFFDTGHYQPLADGLAKLILRYLPSRGLGRLVLDAGCGEGYYLRRLGDALDDASQDQVVRCGLDISKHGLRLAARRDPDGVYAVAGTYRMPVLPSRVDVLLTHFSPISADDFYRVVRPRGVILVGGPGEEHLYGLKRLLYATPERTKPEDALSDEPGFELLAEHSIRYPLGIRGEGQVADLLAMTPFYWSVPAAVHDRIAALEQLDTEVDVVVRAYRRRPSGEARADTASPEQGRG